MLFFIVAYNSTHVIHLRVDLSLVAISYSGVFRDDMRSNGFGGHRKEILEVKLQAEERKGACDRALMSLVQME